MSIIRNNQRHGFHLVDPSPWPLIAAFSALMLTFGGVLYMHGYVGGVFLWRYGFVMCLLIMYVWWRDIIREGTIEGQHTRIVQDGLRMGMILFIVSEVMFFFAFFWAFFHSSFNPSVAIGGVWPPAFMTIFRSLEGTLLNTVILLSSGATVTWAHHAIVWGSKSNASIALVYTLIFAIVFTALQVFEYITSPFSLSDSVFGSTFFFLATGFHGLHVFIGTCFLGVCLVRLYLNHFTREHHFGF